jgi:hypothetical protein
MYLEKILNPLFIVAINIAIIIAAEATGDLFLRTGAIHIIALVFLFLGISRIFVHYRTFDQYLQPMVFGSVAALLLFSFSHVVEYASFEHDGHELYADALYVDVTNMYMTAMLLVALGAQFFLYKRTQRTAGLTIITALFVAIFAATLFGLLRMYELSIEPDEPWIYLYSVLVLLVTLVSANRMLVLGKSASLLKKFTGYIVISFILIAVAALDYLLYELLEELGVAAVQIVYISHFLFFAALSLMFLAYPKLAKPQGLYALDNKNSI